MQTCTSEQEGSTGGQPPARGQPERGGTGSGDPLGTAVADSPALGGPCSTCFMSAKLSPRNHPRRRVPCVYRCGSGGPKVSSEHVVGHRRSRRAARCLGLTMDWAWFHTFLEYKGRKGVPHRPESVVTSSAKTGLQEQW